MWAGPLHLTGLAGATIGMKQEVQIGQNREVRLFLAGGVADSGPGTIAGGPVGGGQCIPLGAELPSKIALLAVLHETFIIRATRLTDEFSANIRLHSFTWSGVSAGGRPGGLPSALARSWPTLIHSLVESIR